MNIVIKINDKRLLHRLKRPVKFFSGTGALGAGLLALSFFKDDPVIHQVHQLDPGMDDLLIPEDADQAEDVFALGFNDVNGLHEQDFFSVAAQICACFTHGSIPL